MNGQSAQPALPAPRDSSLLRAHARWIVSVAVLAMASAVLVTWVFQKPEYRSQVKVLVGPRLPTGGSPVPPDMETEVQVATSGVVVTSAARELGVPASSLRKRLSVSVPADSTVLVFRYADPASTGARRRAAALADAYITYRVGQSSVLSPASAPRSPAGPNYPLNALAGLAVGLLLGTGTAFVRDRLDDRLRGAVDFQALVGLPVLATLPARGTEDVTGGREPVMVTSPQSPAAEPYRFLRGKVVKAADGRREVVQHDGPVVVMVTSTAHDDGAARVAVNAAAAIAHSGARVVLVDGDPRSSELSELLDVDVDRLVVLHRAAAWSTPGDHLSLRSLRAHFDRLPDVDYVVVLSPPVLTAADSLVWADVADLVLLVAAAGQSLRRELVAATAELRGARGRLLGGVLYDGPLPTSGSTARAIPAGSPGPDDDGASTTAPQRRGAHEAVDELATPS